MTSTIVQMRATESETLEDGTQTSYMDLIKLNGTPFPGVGINTSTSSVPTGHKKSTSTSSVTLVTKEDSERLSADCSKHGHSTGKGGENAVAVTEEVVRGCDWDSLMHTGAWISGHQHESPGVLMFLMVGAGRNGVTSDGRHAL